MKQRLSMRNLMAEIRDSGVQIRGPKSLHPRDIQAFANTLDTLLAKRVK